MKTYNLILCVVASSALAPFATRRVVHADERPRAARVDVTQTKDNSAQADRNTQAARRPPTTERTAHRNDGKVRMGPTTVTVIDDGEAIDDVVSRVRRARIEQLRQEQARQEAKERPLNPRPEIRFHRERANTTDKNGEGESDSKKLNPKAEDRGDKAEARDERRDEANDKREERRDRIREKREQRMQMDRPVRGGRAEK